MSVKVLVLLRGTTGGTLYAVSCLCCLFEVVFFRFGPDPCVICDFTDCFLCLFGGFISLIVVDSNRFKFFANCFVHNVPVAEN
jgi:hypothetical protein